MRAERDAILAQLAAVGHAFDAAALHRLRIRFRRLRYAAEIADALRGRESEAAQLSARCRSPRGRLHDSWLLAEWLGPCAARARAASQELRAKAADREQALATEAARRHHAELSAKDLRALLEHGLEAILRLRAA